MLPLLLVVLAADAAKPAPISDGRARDTAALASSWAMAGAAGLEALSAAAFSIDAELGLR